MKYLYVIFHIELNIRWRVGMAPENHGHGWGSAPYGQSDSISRRWAASKPDSWKDEARPRPLLSSSGALTLLNMAWTSLKLREAAPSNARAGPLDSRLENQPFMGLRLCQSRNGATNSTIAEESFPRWRHATWASKVSQSNAWKPRGTRNKELNSRGKTKRSKSLL